jgi:hypothetical protein
MSLPPSTDGDGLLGEPALAIHDRASDVNHVTHHGRSSTSVIYTQTSTCPLRRFTTMELPFDFDSSRPLLLLCRHY